MRYFCTYFDRHYVPRALVMFESLSRCSKEEIHLFALCLDAESHKLLSEANLSNVTLVSLDELEQAHPELLATKAGRSKVEYYYTCGPSFLLYLLETHPTIDLLTYLDSDLYFFADPKPLFGEVQGHSIGIIEHRLPKKLESFKRFGTYNVGWVSFRRSEPGIECLQWWADRCIEWCYDHVESSRFADQKYLDEFPTRFKAVRVIQHKGANLAPWNVANYRIMKGDDSVMVDEQPLIFFHFQGFKMIRPWLFDTNFGWYKVSPSAVVRQSIVRPYIRELKQASRTMNRAQTIRARSRGFGWFTRFGRTVVGISFGLIHRAYIVSFR